MHCYFLTHEYPKSLVIYIHFNVMVVSLLFLFSLVIVGHKHCWHLPANVVAVVVVLSLDADAADAVDEDAIELIDTS